MRYRLSFVCLSFLLMTSVPAVGGTPDLPMTFEIENVDGRNIPLQNGRPLITLDPQDRPTLDLGGVWKKRRVDVDHDFSLSLRNDEWLSAVQAETNGATQPGFDDSGWTDYYLPMVENIMPAVPEDPVGAEVYSGGIYYRRTFSVPDQWQGRVVRLISLAVDYVADVWINGQWVGYHEGGYGPFVFDVSQYLNYGAENLIVFRVDAMPWMLRMDILPNLFATDWHHYCGIVQDVYLEAAPKINVVRADVIPQNNEGDLNISVVVENREGLRAYIKAQLEVYRMDEEHPDYLTDPVAAHLAGDAVELEGIAEQELEIFSMHHGRLDFDVRIVDADLWTPADPNLYVLIVRLYSGGELVDELNTQFGVRTVETGPEGKLLLNRRPAFFTGMARHEDWPDSGRSASWEKIRDDLQTVSYTHLRAHET